MRPLTSTRGNAFPSYQDNIKTSPKRNALGNPIDRLEENKESGKNALDVKTKHKLLNWCSEIKLIKENAVSIAEFPAYCRNGVFFADLITRLEGVSLYF